MRHASMASTSWGSPSRRRRSSSAASGRRRGLADHVELKTLDYRDLGADSFDAIASIGMVEHVGESQIDQYASAGGAGTESPADGS